MKKEFKEDVLASFVDKYEAQIKEWKSKYTNVFSIVVDDKVCFLRKPDRRTLSYASAVGSADPIKFSEVILENCWLGGDDEIKTDDELFLGASAQLGELIKVKEAVLKKL